MGEVTPDVVLDVRGLECPIPVLRTSETLKGMNPGEVLEVLATDPVAPVDIGAFAWRTGHRLLLTETRDGMFRFLIQHRKVDPRTAAGEPEAPRPSASPNRSEPKAAPPPAEGNPIGDGHVRP
jgi:tRNA 2-thiouridine synthesizing protein A